MSLRARLVVIVVGLSAVAMLVVGGAVAGALQDWHSGGQQDTDALFGRVTGVLVTCSALALVLVAVAGWWSVRRALRPLERMARTADAIRAGDLSRRVEATDRRTEVGRLGTAVNGMLAELAASAVAREQSAERLQQFVADASHELRTPVATIRGYAELFRRGAAERPEDLRKAMARIESEAGRMSSLVDELLQLASLDEARRLERTEVDAVTLVAELVRDVAATAPGRSFELVANRPVTVVADVDRLRQAVGNLVRNVVDHTPESTRATIHVHGDGGYCVISVQDDGPGLTAAHRDRVFERFFRADTARSQASGGAGLGLAIVAAVAAAHGGEARVSTAPGEGSTFTLRLPVRACGAPR